jgi:hypothetical protein
VGQQRGREDRVGVDVVDVDGVTLGVEAEQQRVSRWAAVSIAGPCTKPSSAML